MDYAMRDANNLEKTHKTLKDDSIIAGISGYIALHGTVYLAQSLFHYIWNPKNNGWDVFHDTVEIPACANANICDTVTLLDKNYEAVTNKDNNPITSTDGYTQMIQIEDKTLNVYRLSIDKTCNQIVVKNSTKIVTYAKLQDKLLLIVDHNGTICNEKEIDLNSLIK